MENTDFLNVTENDTIRLEALKEATWLLFACISEFYSAAVEGRALRSTGKLSLRNILRPNSASMPPSK
jgi:hypothetical protein